MPHLGAPSLVSAASDIGVHEEPVAPAIRPGELTLDQRQTAVPPVHRIIRWRYNSAVHAARVLSSIAPEPTRERLDLPPAELRRPDADALCER